MGLPAVVTAAATTAAATTASTATAAALAAATAAATAASATPVSAATTTAAATGPFVFGLVDLNRAAVQLRAIHLADGAGGSFVIGEGYKPEAARRRVSRSVITLASTISAETGKGAMQGLVGRSPTQSAHKQFLHRYCSLLLRCCSPAAHSHFTPGPVGLSSSLPAE